MNGPREPLDHFAHQLHDASLPRRLRMKSLDFELRLRRIRLARGGESRCPTSRRLQKRREREQLSFSCLPLSMYGIFRGDIVYVTDNFRITRFKVFSLTRTDERVVPR